MPTCRSDDGRPARRAATEEDLLKQYLHSQNRYNIMSILSPACTCQRRLEKQAAYVQPPTSGSPFERLPAEIKVRIFRFLDQDDLGRICLTSKRFLDETRPHLYRHVDFMEWFNFLRVARTLLADDGSQWKEDALAQCRQIHLGTSCPNPSLADHAKDVRSALGHRRRTERDFILDEVLEAWTQLARKASRIESIILGCCRTPASLDNFFQALARHPLQSLSFYDVCPLRATAGHTYLSSTEPCIPLLAVPGWDRLENLSHLRKLDLDGVVHSGKDSQYALSGTLDDLLVRCPNLVVLRLSFLPSSFTHLSWVILERLDEYTFPHLRTVDFDVVAAPTRESLKSFLLRHNKLITLRWAGPPWADDTSAPATANTLTRRGAFTVTDGVVIPQPQLQRLSASSMRLLSAILAASSPEWVEHVLVTPDGGTTPTFGDGDDYAGHLFYRDIDPLPTLASCGGLLELSITVSGHRRQPNWKSNVAAIFKKLPASLIVLTIRMPGVCKPKETSVNFYDGQIFPLRLPLQALSHLENVRLLTLPYECIQPYDRTIVEEEQGESADDKRELELDRYFNVMRLCESVSKKLAKQCKRLDAIWYLGTDVVDRLGRPANVLKWRPLVWPDEMAFTAEIIRSEPLPPTPTELERIKNRDSFGVALEVLTRLPFIRDEITDEPCRHLKPSPQEPKDKGKQTVPKQSDEIEKGPREERQGEAAGPSSESGTKETTERSTKSKRQASDPPESEEATTKRSKKSGAESGKAGAQSKVKAKNEGPAFRIRIATEACCCCFCAFKSGLNWVEEKCESGVDTPDMQRRYLAAVQDDEEDDEEEGEEI